MSESDKRQHLSEQVRVAEMRWVEAEHQASCLEEGKGILRDEMINNLLEAGQATSAAQAERVSRTSDQFKGYLRRMHDARRDANQAKAEWRALERNYWAAVSVEATERASMRMTGAGR